MHIQRGLGIDLVAMCVNDLLAHMQISFLIISPLASWHQRYTEVQPALQMGVLKLDALIGGETAEMQESIRQADMTWPALVWAPPNGMPC